MAHCPRSKTKTDIEKQNKTNRTFNTEPEIHKPVMEVIRGSIFKPFFYISYLSVFYSGYGGVNYVKNGNTQNKHRRA